MHIYMHPRHKGAHTRTRDFSGLLTHTYKHKVQARIAKYSIRAFRHAAKHILSATFQPNVLEGALCFRFAYVQKPRF
jgi:hypothetical protein